MQHCQRLSVILKLWNVVWRVRVTLNSVGGGGGGGVIDPPLACQPKSRIRKILRFLHFWDCFLQWNGLKSDLKHLLKHKFRGEGANFSKTKPTNQWKLWKMAKSKQSSLIAIVKTLNIGFISEHIIYLGIGGGLLSTSLLPITCLKMFSVSSSPFHLFFFIKYSRNKLLCVSFLQL